jgi:Xaa-Pro dipeptidase
VTSTAEIDRIGALREAERKAANLFEEAVARGLIVAGTTERELSDQIRDLANEMFGVRKFWHKRIVRSGANTMEPYRSNPADLTIQSDDIVFFDFGPIFEDWEADFGRTYVVGDDAAKHRLAQDLPRIWNLGRERFRGDPDITGEQLFSYVLGVIADAGWGHGASHAGHLVGEFPHERINGDEIECYVTTGSTQPMRRPDAAGNQCHWILEVHLVDSERGFGGFFEQLLDL